MKKLVLIFATALTAVCSYPDAANAQVPVSAANADLPITSGNTTDARNVNCDMMLHAIGGGQLRAIVYDDYNTNTSYLHVEDYSGGVATVAIPNAIDIDVALGDDWSNPGNDFIAVVAYNSSTVPMIEGFSIVGTGTGSLTVSSTGASTLPLVTGGPSHMPPHVDMYPDPGNLINGLPSLHEFGITWVEYSGGNDVYFTNADNGSIGGFGNVYTVTSGGNNNWPDVACLWDLSVNEPYAYVTYMNGSDIDIWEVNIVNMANGVIAPGINAGMPTEKSVRIEAMGLYNPGGGFQKYQLAYAAYDSGPFLDMFSYNDLVGNFNLSAAGVGLNNGNNIHPAVSAGPGQVVGGGYGNENQSICWYNDATPFYYSQAIHTSTGFVNPVYPDYYEVNQNPMPFIVLDAYYAPIGVSTSSNWGNSDLLTAWVNDFDIYYKYQTDIQQYKPTNVKVVPAANYRLYPNPAATTISIDGMTRADYTITDITGRILLKGEVAKANNIINIESLSKGMYIASITENGQTKVLKFVKH